MKTNNKRNILIMCCMLLVFSLTAFSMFFNNNSAHAEEVDEYEMTITLKPDNWTSGNQLFVTETLTAQYFLNNTWYVIFHTGLIQDYPTVNADYCLFPLLSTSGGITYLDLTEPSFTLNLTSTERSLIDHYGIDYLAFSLYCGDYNVYRGIPTNKFDWFDYSPHGFYDYFEYSIANIDGSPTEEKYYTIDFADTDLYFKEPAEWRGGFNFDLANVNTYIDEPVQVTLSNNGSNVVFFQGYLECDIYRINTSEGEFSVDNYWYKLSITNFKFLISEYIAVQATNATVDKTGFLLLAGSLELCNAADESSNNYKLNYTITEHETEPTVTDEDYTPPPLITGMSNYVKINNIQSFTFYTDILNNPTYYLEEPIRMYYKDDLGNLCYLSTYATMKFYSYTRVEFFKTRIIHVITIDTIAFPIDSATKTYFQEKTPEIFLNFGRPNEVAYLSAKLPEKFNDTDKYDNCYFAPECIYGLLSAYDMPTENEYTDNGYMSPGDEFKKTFGSWLGLPEDWTFSDLLKKTGGVFAPLIIAGAVVFGVWLYGKVKKK